MPRHPHGYIHAQPVLLISFLLLLMSLPAFTDVWSLVEQTVSAATTFTVNSTGDGADSNLGDGVCNDGSGACTLRAAIQEANNISGDDTITFSILPSSTISLNTALPDITGNLTITGPGSTLLTVTRSTAGGTPNFRIIAINSGPTITISGLTITNGITASSLQGGGIFNGATLTLNDVAVDGNQTSGTAGSGGWGGGISNGGTLTLNNCSVNNNRTASGGSGGFGGAILNTGTLIVNSSTINNNQTGNGSLGNGGSGGAIFNHGTVTLSNTIVSGNLTGTGGSGGGGGIGGAIASTGMVTLINSHIDNNTAAGNGGGIHNSSSLTLMSSTVSGNQTTNSTFASFGGGIYNDTIATLTLTDSIIGGNHTGNSTSGGAGGYGGGVYNLGTMTTTGSTISGNQTGIGIMVAGYGGGVFNGGTFSLTNSTVSGNQTGNLGNPEGGGVQNVATLTSTNSTISNNSALGPFGHGGGLNNVSGTITLQNTIVAGNFRVNSATPDDIGGSVVLSSSFNLIGTGGSGGLINGVNNNQVGVADPRLGPLANNGGPAETHALLAGSPALDAGDNAFVTNPPFNGPPFTDQRGAGFTRIVDGPDAATTDTVDIGAFEAQISLADIPDQTINEDGSLSLPFNVGGAASITGVTATSSNAILVPNNPPNISITGSGSSRTLLVNPVANQFGTSTITVSVNGANGQNMVDTFLLTVTSLNDAPTDLALSSSSVADNSAANTPVGNFSTTDIDVGDTFTYSLVFGAGSVDNTSFNISGNQLRTSAVFDFESKPSYSVRVRSTDSGGGFFEKQFAITVTDGPDNPGAISFSAANYNVGEGDGNASITVTRTGGTDNNIVAKVTLADITTSSADYQFTPGGLDQTFTQTGTGLDNYVLAIAQQSDGKTIVAGFFASYNGTALQYVARLNSDGSLDNSFAQTGTGLNGFVRALVIQPDGKVIVGGDFTAYDGTTRSRIARLNSDGTLDTTFAQTGTGLNDIVRGLAVQKDGKIVVVGHFTSYNDTTRSRVARLNSNGTLDVTFPASGIGTDGTVVTVAIQSDEKIIIGGLFSEYGGVFRRNLARLNANGSLDMTFSQSPALSLTVIALALQPDGKVIIGGGGGFTPFNVGRLNSDGSLDSSFGQTGTGFDGVVTTLALQSDGKVVVGGFFSFYNGTPRSHVARLNTDGTLDFTFTQTGTGLDTFSNPYALAIQPDGKVIVGGTFAAYNGTPRFFIARLQNDYFVTWAAGDSSNRTINLPIIDDSLDEPNETLAFTVTPLTGGATTGTNPTATLTIVDNDPGVTSLSAVSGSGVFGGTANLTATLTSLGSPLNGQSVSFTLNGTAVGSATTNSSGVATLTGVGLAGINAGFYPTAVGASFTGDGINYLSSNNTGPLGVGKASTATSVVSSVNPSALGQSVTFTATVTSSAGIPTGTVQFKSDGSNIGAPVALNASGVATFITSALNAGTHTITAEYGGDSNFILSTGTLSASQVVTPSLSINDVSISEGHSGTITADFIVTLAAASNAQVTVGFVTANSTATAGSDYQANSGTVTFNPGQTTRPISITVNGDVSFESNETFFVILSNPVNATISDSQGLGTILNDDAQGGFISFSQSDYTVGESGGLITITVIRTGDLSGAATVDYATPDDSGSAVVLCPTVSGIASSRCDFTTALGTLRFAAGEGSKTFEVLISQDNYVEGTEVVPLSLSNLTGGALFVTPSSATITITDDASGPATNPIDVADSFVRQHYHDFLNREPDAAGLAFWTNQITECEQPGATCNAEVRRINVSAAFFLSIEFQETGYLVERLYKSSYGDAVGTSTIGGTHQLSVPVIRFTEFLPDTQEIGRGFVVGQPGSEQVLENNKQAFIAEFVQRSRFTIAYPTTMATDQFVDALFTNSGVMPSASERMLVIGEFGGASTSTDSSARARALRRVAENTSFVQQEFNKAFVLMQYFGYLRRNPNDTPDSDYSGYEFWLGKLNQFGGNFIDAEMVKAFIISGEYRQRFGP